MTCATATRGAIRATTTASIQHLLLGFRDVSETRGYRPYLRGVIVGTAFFIKRQKPASAQSALEKNKVVHNIGSTPAPGARARDSGTSRLSVCCCYFPALPLTAAHIFQETGTPFTQRVLDVRGTELSAASVLSQRTWPTYRTPEPTMACLRTQRIQAFRRTLRPKTKN